MLTAEELEKKKKRDAERMWKKILAYYMMETYERYMTYAGMDKQPGGH